MFDYLLYLFDRHNEMNVLPSFCQAVGIGKDSVAYSSPPLAVTKSWIETEAAVPP